MFLTTWKSNIILRVTTSTSLSSNVLSMLAISVVANFLTQISFYLSRSVSSPRRSTDASTMLKSVTDVSECDYRHDSTVTTGQLQGVQEHNASYPDYCRTLTIRGELFCELSERFSSFPCIFVVVVVVFFLPFVFSSSYFSSSPTFLIHCYINFFFVFFLLVRLLSVSSSSSSQFFCFFVSSSSSSPQWSPVGQHHVMDTVRPVDQFSVICNTLCYLPYCYYYIHYINTHIIVVFLLT